MIENLHITRDSPIPRFLQLKSQFEYLIVTGQLPPGSKLPSIREVSRALGIGTATMVRAYGELEAAGLAVPNGGVGYFVLGNDLSRHGSHGEVRDEIQQLLHRAVQNELSLDQVTQIFMAAVAEMRVALAKPEVVMVSKRDGRLEELAMRLRHSLADLNVEVSGLSLEDLANDREAWIPRLRRASHVLALLFDIKQARALLHGQGLEIIPLLMTPSEEVRERIIHLPPGTQVGIVASSLEFVDGMITGVTTFNPNVVITGTTDTRDRRRLKRLLDRCECVIYGTLGRAMVNECLPNSVEGIELMYVPDETSVQRLRAMLLEEGRG